MVGRRPGVGDDVAVGEGRALGPAGGAAGVEQDRGVGGVPVLAEKSIRRAALPVTAPVLGVERIRDRRDRLSGRSERTNFSASTPLSRRPFFQVRDIILLEQPGTALADLVRPVLTHPTLCSL